MLNASNLSKKSFPWTPGISSGEFVADAHHSWLSVFLGYQFWRWLCHLYYSQESWKKNWCCWRSKCEVCNVRAWCFFSNIELFFTSKLSVIKIIVVKEKMICKRCFICGRLFMRTPWNFEISAYPELFTKDWIFLKSLLPTSHSGADVQRLL